MESILKHGNRWKKERGLTLVETIIALAIIVIVSVAVVSITVYSTNALKTMNIKAFFSHEIDNMATLFLSYDDSEYITGVNKVTGATIAKNNNDIIYYNASYEYSDNTDYSYYIGFNYDSSTLTLTAYQKDGETIFSRSVTR